MINRESVFSISLDFELHWGIFDRISIDHKKEYFDNTIKCIPKILDLFKRYKIEATWATVGMLFNESIDELKNDLPEELPSYKNEQLNTYGFIEEKLSEDNFRFYLAPRLIMNIEKTPGQEIGTHTYCHYYCSAEGQNVNQFEADIKKCIKIANNRGLSLKSIVFPRNQINLNYLQVCSKYGINNIRVNPGKRLWKGKKMIMLKKILRTLDCYIPLFYSGVKLEGHMNKKNAFTLLPASRFFRPVSKYKILNKLKLNRIKNEMTKIAKNGDYYHLWWHPHNFGDYPEESLKELDVILKHFTYLKNKYNMKSLNMGNSNNLFN